MEDLIAWEADPLAFKVTALDGDNGYGVKDGGDDDGSYDVKYEDVGCGIDFNLMEVFGILLSWLPFDTFPSKNYLSSVTS